MYNYKLVIQYDGTRYDGWQRMGKDESINTIEYKIAEILRKMTGEEIQDILRMQDRKRCPCKRSGYQFQA